MVAFAVASTWAASLMAACSRAAVRVSGRSRRLVMMSFQPLGDVCPVQRLTENAPRG
jgi:hypothetical protein